MLGDLLNKRVMFMYALLKEFQKERDSVTIGLSTLKTVAMGGLQEKPSVKIAIPDNLKRLISTAADGSDKHSKFLVRIINEFDPEIVKISEGDLISRLDRAFKNLSEMNMLVIITDDYIDKDVANALEDSFPDLENMIALSPKRNFLREYYTKTISWCRKEDRLILEKTRHSFNSLGQSITTLQIPDKFDMKVSSKKKHIDKVFSFKGGIGCKWLIAMVFGAAALAHPALGLPGLFLTVMDP